jgi:hypothetical protein
MHLPGSKTRGDAYRVYEFVILIAFTDLPPALVVGPGTVVNEETSHGQRTEEEDQYDQGDPHGGHLPPPGTLFSVLYLYNTQNKPKSSFLFRKL